MDTLPDMLQALAAVFPDGPSWPFRTRSAVRMWDAASQVIEERPDYSVGMVLQTAAGKAGVPGYEMTPEDYATLIMATRWKLREMQIQGRKPTLPAEEPEAPKAPTKVVLPSALKKALRKR